MKSKRVRTDVLEIAYEEHGPENGAPVILLHGFPYDARAFDEVAPPLGRPGVPGAGALPARLRPDAVPVGRARRVRASRRRWATTCCSSWMRSASAGRRWSATTGAAAPPASSRPAARAGALPGELHAATTSRTSRPRASRRRPSRSIASGTSTTSTPSAAAPASPRTGATSAGCCGSCGRRNGLRRSDLRAERRLVRQSRFRRRRDTVLPAPLRLCARRSGACGHRSRACAAAEDHRADHQSAWWS